MATATNIPMRLTIRGNERSAAQAGTTLQATLAIGHPMESGFRTLESGARVPKNIIEKIFVSVDDALLFELTCSIGISAHPYLVFPVTLPQGLSDKALRLSVRWVDDTGAQGELSRALL